MNGNPLWKFHLKLKNTVGILSEWSRNNIGDIFATTKRLEEDVIKCEEECLQVNSERRRELLNKKNAEMIKHLKLEESFWKQKRQPKMGY